MLMKPDTPFCRRRGNAAQRCSNLPRQNFNFVATFKQIRYSMYCSSCRLLNKGKFLLWSLREASLYKKILNCLYCTFFIVAGSCWGAPTKKRVSRKLCLALSREREIQTTWWLSWPQCKHLRRTSETWRCRRGRAVWRGIRHAHKMYTEERLIESTERGLPSPDISRPYSTSYAK